MGLAKGSVRRYGAGGVDELASAIRFDLGVEHVLFRKPTGRVARRSGRGPKKQCPQWLHSPLVNQPEERRLGAYIGHDSRDAEERQRVVCCVEFSASGAVSHDAQRQSWRGADALRVESRRFSGAVRAAWGSRGDPSQSARRCRSLGVRSQLGSERLPGSARRRFGASTKPLPTASTRARPRLLTRSSLTQASACG